MLDYDNQLCRCISKFMGSIDWAWQAFAFLPERTDLSNINDFRNGRFLKGEYLPDYFSTLLGLGERYVLVFDDVMASTHDLFLKKDETCFFVGDEVYHFIGSSGFKSEENVGSVVWGCGVSWHFLCAIFRVDSEMTVSEFKKMSLNFIAESLVEIVVGAFDGEGFVHFEKP